MRKLVSIILPVYNVSKYLKRNIESLLAQTYKNVEFIYVNDGSKDDSLKIIEHYAQLDNRIIVINKENGGVSSARNAGLKVAKGEYIGFCDPDDYVSPIYIESLVDKLEEYNADVSVCRYVRKKENKKIEKWKINPSYKCFIYNKENALNQLMSGRVFNVCTWNKMFRKEIIENVFFDENVYYAEDVHFNYFAMKNANKTVFLDVELYAYIKRKTSLVASKYSDKKITGLAGIYQIIEDCSIHNKQTEDVARAWFYLVNLEMLYYIWRDKVNNFLITDSILKNMDNNVKYLKNSKIIQRYRRLLCPLAKSILANILKQRQKKSERRIRVSNKIDV